MDNWPQDLLSGVLFYSLKYRTSFPNTIYFTGDFLMTYTKGTPQLKLTIVMIYSRIDSQNKKPHSLISLHI